MSDVNILIYVSSHRVAKQNVFEAVLGLKLYNRHSCINENEVDMPVLII